MVDKHTLKSFVQCAQLLRLGRHNFHHFRMHSMRVKHVYEILLANLEKELHDSGQLPEYKSLLDGISYDKDGKGPVERQEPYNDKYSREKEDESRKQGKARKRLLQKKQTKRNPKTQRTNRAKAAGRNKGLARP